MGILPLHILLFGISGGEILIILLAVLVLFGPKKIPEIARMLGRGINEVKKVQREINTEIHRYSADIEQEARKVQHSIDKMKKDLRENAEVSTEERPGDSRAGEEGESSPKADAPGETAPGDPEEADELPFPYNKKTGDGP
ncbi:MAG: twin-arginine translocase TatA/TatE family subunit [Bacteroides sp.]|jgi:TatA/E family protein of Tat protein translocase|nr:twin-arginine translocase TatA/TatE family subunit [Bacteroides sp.]